MLGEGGEHQLAHFTIFDRGTRFGVNDFGVEVILPDVQPVLGLHTFHRNARPHDFAEAVDIDGMHVEGLLDLKPHGVGPRLCAEDADL